MIIGVQLPKQASRDRSCGQSDQESSFLVTGFGLVLQFLLEKGVFTTGDDMPWISFSYRRVGGRCSHNKFSVDEDGKLC